MVAESSAERVAMIQRVPSRPVRKRAPGPRQGENLSPGDGLEAVLFDRCHDVGVREDAAITVTDAL